MICSDEVFIGIVVGLTIGYILGSIATWYFIRRER